MDTKFDKDIVLVRKGYLVVLSSHLKWLQSCCSFCTDIEIILHSCGIHN